MVCDDKLTFGKHIGKSIEWIAANDKDYGHWICDNLYKEHPDIVKCMRRELFLLEDNNYD